MSRFSSQKIASALLVIFFSVVITITSHFALKNIKNDLLSNVQDSLLTVLLSVQKAHSTLISQRLLFAESFSTTPRVIELTDQLLKLHNQGESIVKGEVLKDLRQYVEPILTRYGDLGFFIIAPDGTSIASMRNKNLNSINLIQHHKNELLQRTFAGESVFIPPIISDVPLNLGLTESITMFITVPIKSVNKKVIAVLAFRLDADKYFSDIVQIGRIGESGETYAFDKKGIMLTASRFENQLIKTKRLNFRQHEQLNLRISDPGGNLLKGYIPTIEPEQFSLTKMAQSATAGQSNFNMEGYRDYRGVMVFGSWLWDNNLAIGLTTEIDVEEALQPYYRTRATFLTSIALTFIFALLMLRVIHKLQAESKKRILKAHTELESKVIERTKELSKAKDELSNAFKELEILAITDSLTGLANRRHFDNQLNLEWQRGIRDQKPVSLVFFDIDYFKQYNDNYGHLLGDQCLQKISTMLLDSNVTKRLGDLICRYGGEEFIVLLPASDIQYAKNVAITIKQHVEALCIPHSKSQVKGTDYVTVSIGYASEEDLKNNKAISLIQKADEALYVAKNSGRNKISQYKAPTKIVETNIHEIKHSNEK